MRVADNVQKSMNITSEMNEYAIKKIILSVYASLHILASKRLSNLSLNSIYSSITKGLVCIPKLKRKCDIC